LLKSKNEGMLHPQDPSLVLDVAHVYYNILKVNVGIAVLWLRCHMTAVM
jgi:hypothetical protein